MARRAFIFGSNGPATFGQLKYAEADALRVAKQLKGKLCEFEITRPAKTAPIEGVQGAFRKVTNACSREDTLIAYFAGHGVLEKGELYLIWDKNEELVVNAGVRFDNLFSLFRQCKAENKLFILDCCRAGGAAPVTRGDIEVNAVVAANSSPANEGENQLVLAASERIGVVREFEEYGGSFLAAKLCEALGQKFEEADQDADLRLSVDDLMEWLLLKAREHNQNSLTPVETPYLLNVGGKKKGSLYLTQDILKWRPYEISFPDNNTMVVLPIRPEGERVLCIGKHPVTNSQYRRFVEATGHKEPVGSRLERGPEGSPDSKQYIIGHWQTPFYPWREEGFASDELPVVCVSYKDALAYCRWVDRMSDQRKWVDRMFTQKKRSASAFLPTTGLWDYAAFGREYREWNNQVILDHNPHAHHHALSPLPVDAKGDRSNLFGVSDMIGNVWEWCDGAVEHHTSAGGSYRRAPEIRGGGFVDDLASTPIFLDAEKLREGTNTMNFDLGFRIAGMCRLNSLPKEVQARLIRCKEASSYIWTTYLLSARQ